VDEVVRAFQVNLGETGPISAGRCIHYSADIICSGALEIWMRYCMEYAVDHIGAASPRIFLYLKKRFDEIEQLASHYDSETLYANYEFQAKIGEIVLILKDSVRRSKVTLPKIHFSCFNDAWITEARSTRTQFQPVQRSIHPQKDAPTMTIAANEIAKAVEEGGTEGALFWMRWLLDTDTSLKKAKGQGLSAVSRGPPGWPDKMRSNVGFFLANLAVEIYKDFATRGKIRMHEEFAAIVDLYKTPNKRILTTRRRLDLLCLLFQLLCEVPRWRVPAAPVLVKDPVVMRKGLVHLENFFREVLAYKMPMIDIMKEAKKVKQQMKKKATMNTKQTALENRLAVYDAAVNDFMSK
jgi:hypothetical protein